MFCRRNVSHIMLFISRVHNFRALNSCSYTGRKVSRCYIDTVYTCNWHKIFVIAMPVIHKNMKLSPTEHSSWMASNTSLLHWKSLVLLIYTALVHQGHMYSLVTLLQLFITITFCSSCVTVLITVQTHATGSLNCDA